MRMKKTSYGDCSPGKQSKLKILLIAILLFPFAGGHLSAQADKKVTVNVRDARVRTVLDQLQKETALHFMYEEKTIDSERKVTLSYDNAPLYEVLEDLCRQASMRYEVKENVVLLFPQKVHTPSKESPKPRLSGRVTDEYKVELTGVNIKIKGTAKGAITDIDGRYELDAAPGDTLLFSYVGMENRQVRVRPGIRTIDVRMVSSQTAIGEVMITGYQTLSKERATGSYSVISEKDTKGKLETNIMSRIEGMVAGMNSTGTGFNRGQIAIRGITTYEGNQAPLYVVDGLPYEGDISAINPSDVQNITVLKDAAAASIYGARSANGVIVITTRRGQSGATRISYNGSIMFSPKPDLGYLDLINSSELVDLQIEGFNFYHTDYGNLNRRRALNPVVDLLYRHEQGLIDDLEGALLPYRNTGNRKEIEKEFARTGVSRQHNVSVSGGSERSRYMFSFNYMKNLSHQKHEYDERIGFNFKNNAQLFRWLSADIGVSGSFNKADNRNNSYPAGNEMAEGGYVDLISLYPGYYTLRDAGGAPNPWLREKSPYELERLKGIGLMDETYSPVSDKSKEHFHSNDDYYRVYAGLTFHITEGLSVDLKYQTENTNRKDRKLYSADSWVVKNMINNAAVYDKNTDELTLNVPKGGQLDERRGDQRSYTFRAQANFNRTFCTHDISAIAGAERRMKRDTQTRVYYMGYDENSLGYTSYDPKLLFEIDGTEAVNGYFSWSSERHNRLYHKEDRYVSFYGNASYTYNNRYLVTGSLRIDQSNLFGTNTRHQYRPLWSVGGSWLSAEEGFMKDIDWINRLNMRVTYGIGGNVPKSAGPYLNVSDAGYNYWIDANSSTITNPPNPQLRWEKTATTNFGVDFSLLNYRLNGSIDLYRKKTSDLLGPRNTDPTIGWSQLLVNYGTMKNKGIEIGLQSVNIRNRNFSWETDFIFSHNKNKLTNLEGTEEAVFNYVSYDVAAVGYPLNSLFSYRYAGLDPANGNVLVYNGDGEKVENVDSVDELVYSGTRVPKYTASIRNTFSFMNFDLSFMFVYYGGHVMRDVVADYIGGAPAFNLNKKALNHWRKPGDENIPGVAPSLNRNVDYYDAQTWYSADIHVKKADYIKLRNVSLGYNVPGEWLRKYKINSLTLTCQVTNPWWWAKNGRIDPEAYSVAGYGTGALTLPNPTTYTLGLSIDF